MKTKLTLAILGTALMLSASAASELAFLRPLFTEKDRVTEPLLAGSWSDSEDHDDHPLVITDLKDGDYLVDLKGWNVLLKAHLVHLGGFQFLDLSPATPKVEFGSYTLLPPPHVTQTGEGVFLVLAPSEKDDRRDSARGEILQAHLICRIRVDVDNLHVACLDEDRVAEAVAHAELSTSAEGKVATSSTEELRKFILRHAEDDRLFSDKLDLHRQKTETDKP